MENEYSMITFKSYKLILESKIDSIFKALPKNGFKLEDVVKSFDTNTSTAASWLKRLVDKGKIERAGFGVYVKKGEKIDPKFLSSSEENVLNAIPKGGIKLEDLIKKTKAKRKEINYRLRILKKEGKLKGLGRGIWIKDGDNPSKEMLRFIAGETASKIFDTIPKGGIRISELSKKTKIDQNNVRKLLNALEDKGKVEKVSKGVFIKKGDRVDQKVIGNSYGKFTEKITKAIPKNNQQFTLAEIIKTVNAKTEKQKATVYAVIAILIKKGKLERVKRGVYKMKKGTTVSKQSKYIDKSSKDETGYPSMTPSIKWNLNIA
jgi:predicted transcriptional regulator